MNKALGLLGIAKKAGFLEIGDDTVSKAASGGKARLILSAGDASEPSKKRARGYAESRSIAWIELSLTKEELAAVIGRGAPGMLAVTDTGLAHAIAKHMASESPGLYAEAEERLREADERARARRRELEAHKRNIRTGKRRTGR